MVSESLFATMCVLSSEVRPPFAMSRPARDGETPRDEMHLAGSRERPIYLAEPSMHRGPGHR